MNVDLSTKEFKVVPVNVTEGLDAATESLNNALVPNDMELIHVMESAGVPVLIFATKSNATPEDPMEALANMTGQLRNMTDQLDGMGITEDFSDEEPGDFLDPDVDWHQLNQELEKFSASQMPND